MSLEAEGSSASGVHVAAFATAALLGFVILRIFAVSAYDWETAFLVSTALSLDDGISLLFGSLMAGQLLTAILLAVVMPLLIAGILWAPRNQRPVLVLLAVLSLVLVLGLTLRSRFWWLLPAIALIFGLLTLIRRLAVQHRLRKTATTAVARVGWLVPIALLVVAAFVQTPWVPQERIDTQQGVIIGYVLSVEPGFLNVLTDQNEFMIIVSGDVISRS